MSVRVVLNSNKYQTCDFILTDESSRSEEMNLFSRVYSRFPGDCGCFCVFLFNYVCLEEGQSIYIGANEPHAYLKGGNYKPDHSNEMRYVSFLYGKCIEYLNLKHPVFVQCRKQKQYLNSIVRLEFRNLLLQSRYKP